MPVSCCLRRKKKGGDFVNTIDSSKKSDILKKYRVSEGEILKYFYLMKKLAQII